jgi:sterol desaturase/sphingolipid hydroxylase (fatty acid hydroxylase superfamily)
MSADLADTTIIGPLTETVNFLSSPLWEILGDNTPPDLHWQVLLLTLVLAVAIFVVRRGHGAKGADGKERKSGLVQFLLPRDIYTHESARVDLWLWLFERLLHPLWAVSLLAVLGPSVEQGTIGILQQVFGASPTLTPNYAWMLLYSLLILLTYDFQFFLIHYTMHKVPALWAIHKVHHSAEVLTPLTRTREHFLAGPIWACGAALAYALPAGIFAYLFAGNITEATLINYGLFSLLFGFNGSFRHYHVQFRYPRWLEKWLQSPAMHHTHHSYLRQHWDTNMAAVTSIWDRMFGTLYIPEPDEYTPWGIGPEEQGQYRSFWQNTVGPFREWWGMLKGKTTPAATPSTIQQAETTAGNAPTES